VKAKGFFSLCYYFQTSPGAHAASYPMDIGGSFPGRVKRSGREAELSHPSSAEMKNAWNYTFTSLLVYLHSPNMSSWRGA